MGWKEILKRHGLSFLIYEAWHWMIRDRKVTYFKVRDFLVEAVCEYLIGSGVPKFEKTKDYDKLIVDIQKWVKENINYKGDSFGYGVKEYWATPAETLTFRYGDCEDGAILIYALARQNGIPPTQIFLHCGEVEWQGSIGGHCWVEYYSPDLKNNYIIDWCYYPNTAALDQKLKAESDTRYVSRWWNKGITDIEL